MACDVGSKDIQYEIQHAVWVQIKVACKKNVSITHACSDISAQSTRNLPMRDCTFLSTMIAFCDVSVALSVSAVSVDSSVINFEYPSDSSQRRLYFCCLYLKDNIGETAKILVRVGVGAI